MTRRRASPRHSTAPSSHSRATRSEHNSTGSARPRIPTPAGTHHTIIRVHFEDGEQPVDVAHAVQAILNIAAGLDVLPMLQFLAFSSALTQVSGPSAEDIASFTTIEKCPDALRGQDCVVCATALTGRHNVRTLRCSHAFHPKCIDRWLSDHNNCPLCRSTIVPELTDSSAAG
jgi:hypothetical protein